jgi:NADH-quinone oxidoreductase subunit C
LIGRLYIQQKMSKEMSKEEELKKKIELMFEDSHIDIQRKKRLIVTVRKESLSSMLIFLKDNGFEHLSAISCVDWIEDKEFELIYRVSCFGDGLHVMLKIKISRDNPEFITITPIFKNAQTYEREIWEMFGVNFGGNSRLIQLFLDRWKGMPPFRKDFDTREYVEETFEPIPSLESE